MQKKQNVCQLGAKIKFTDEAISGLKLKSKKRIQITFKNIPGSMSGVSLRYTPGSNNSLKVFMASMSAWNKCLL